MTPSSVRTNDSQACGAPLRLVEQRQRDEPDRRGGEPGDEEQERDHGAALFRPLPGRGDVQNAVHRFRRRHVGSLGRTRRCLVPRSRVRRRRLLLGALGGLLLGAAFDPVFGLATHLVFPDLRTITSHRALDRRGLVELGQGDEPDRPRRRARSTRTRSGSTGLRSFAAGATAPTALVRSLATTTSEATCTCPAADTFEASARREVDSCPVRVTFAPRALVFCRMRSKVRAGVRGWGTAHE